MGLRIKIIFGFILFCVIFGLRIFCANCQQIERDSIIEESRLHSQIWHLTATTVTPSNFDFTPSESYLNNYENNSSWPEGNQPLRRRRPGLRKRKRRPSYGYTTEYADFQEHWRGHVQDDPIGYRNENQELVISSNKESSTLSPKIHWNTYPSRTTKYSERTEKVREPLAALEKEQKLFELRDKQRKELESDTSSTVRDKSYRKPYSQAKLEIISSTQSSNQPATNLKNILKNSGGLSLSEILQQKNLSLDDLLKGKQNALQALQMTTPAAVTESDIIFKNTKPVRRIPWSYLVSSTTSSSDIPDNVQIDRTNDRIIQKDSQNDSSIVDNDSRATIQTKNEISSESTPSVVELATIITLRDNPPLRNSPRKPEKKIIFPSLSKSKIFGSATSSSMKPMNSSDEKEEIEKKATYVIGTTETTSTTIRPNKIKYLPESHYQNLKFQRSQIKKLTTRLPLKLHSNSSSSSSSESNSKEQMDDLNSETKQTSVVNSKNSQESVEDKLKKTKPESNLIDKFTNFEDTDSKEMAKLEDLFGSSSQTITPRIDKFTENFSNSKGIELISAQKHDVTETNPSLFVDIANEQLDDHTDILELLEDRRSSSRLFKILAQRNMTLDELIEHRKRGSSQLHLAEIIHNKTTVKPTPSKQTPISNSFNEKMDVVTAFENFPQFNLANLKSIKPDEIKIDSQGSSYFTSIIDIEPTDEVYKESRSVKIDQIDLEPKTQIHQQQQQSSIFNPDTVTNTNNFKLFPQWKTFSLASYTSSQENNFFDNSNTANRFTAHLSSAASTAAEQEIGIDPVFKIENEAARPHHDLLDLELSGHGFKRNVITLENTQISNGMRSAIIASSVIVITSLVIFLIIFVACRWKHNKRRKLTYTDTYNAIKSRLPIISSGQSLGSISNNSNPVTFSVAKSNKLNTMDPNSPEVQEYLFDAIRKQF